MKSAAKFTENYVYNILRFSDGGINSFSPQVKQSVIINTSCLTTCQRT